MERDDENRMSAVERTMLILETLSKAEAINLENMAKMTALPKATLLRFLSSLISLGYVYRDSADQYHLTLKMFMVGSRSLSHIDLVSTAKPFAKKLSQELGETVHMGILEDDEAVYVLKEESSYTLRMYSRVGKIIPLYCTAIGKVFLSEMSEEELDGYLSTHTLKPFTPKSLDESGLRAELKEIHSRGWAIDREEHEENIVCIASPIRDYSGKAVAAISASWPVFRFSREDLDKNASLVSETACEISSILGFCD